MTSTPSSFVLASGNAGKIKELQALLPDFILRPQTDFLVPDIAETGGSFVENAILKARNAAHYSKLPAIADDSGLVVHALNGAPGIYSARYAGAHASDAQNITTLLANLNAVAATERRAYFFCVLVFMRHENDPCPIIAQGRWDGVILDHPEGELGFGYDPIFGVLSHQCSAAQLSLEVKNRLSHRGKALDQLKQALFEHGVV